MANATTSAEVTTSDKIKALIKATPAVIKTGDVAKINAHRDGIIVLRALLGSGGMVKMTNGKNEYCGSDTGLTQVFDDCLAAMLETGMVDKAKCRTIISRDKAGRPKAEVTEVSRTILL